MIRKITVAVLSLALVLPLVSCATSGYAPGVVVAGHPAHAFLSTIKGRVTSGGFGVAAVRVSVNGYGHYAFTNALGEFAIHFRTTTPAGIHSMGLKLAASKPGLPVRTVGITLRDGGTTWVRIRL